MEAALSKLWGASLAPLQFLGVIPNPGNATPFPLQIAELIEARLKRAKEHYAENYRQQQKEEKDDSGD